METTGGGPGGGAGRGAQLNEGGYAGTSGAAGRAAARVGDGGGEGGGDSGGTGTERAGRTGLSDKPVSAQSQHTLGPHQTGRLVPQIPPAHFFKQQRPISNTRGGDGIVAIVVQ